MIKRDVSILIAELNFTVEPGLSCQSMGICLSV
jgi:hypothetical protein